MRKKKREIGRKKEISNTVSSELVSSRKRKKE